MTQSRRVSPRIPYDEAICLARLDGGGRLYGRGLDLSASGVSLVSTETCPIGTEIKCDILLPHGPRKVSGKIVRVTAAPGGFELAVAFGELKPAVAAMIDHLLSDRRPSADVALDDVPRTRTRRDGAVTAAPENVGAALRDGVRPGQTSSAPPVRLPPKNLPPLCGQPLPSVVVAAGLNQDIRAVESQQPRRRVQGTAQMRKPDLSTWWRPAVAMGVVAGPMAAAIATERLATLEHPSTWGRAWWAVVPIALALGAAIVQLHSHFSL